MTREEIQDFTARISQANRSELVVISYDMILTYMAHAKEVINEDSKAFIWNIKQAKNVLEELMGALDFNYPEISMELMRLYQFIQRQFNSCIFKKQDINLDAVERIINRLRMAFEKVAEEDTSGPVMENTSKLYVGLTYGKDMQSDITATKRNI